MESVSIRNLRGKSLREYALRGKPLAITNHRALIGVVIPVAAAWVDHLIDYNWSHVRQSIAEGEQEIATGKPLTTLQDLINVPDAGEDDGNGEVHGHHMPERLAVPLVAALTGETVVQSQESEEIVERLRSAWNPGSPGSQRGSEPGGQSGSEENQPAGPSVRTVRIGDLTAGLIEKAGATGQTLAITHDRELIGIVIPVTRGLVEFLLEQNMSRLLYNIGLGEKQIRTPEKMTTLGQVPGRDGPQAGEEPAKPSLVLKQ